MWKHCIPYDGKKLQLLNIYLLFMSTYNKTKYMVQMLTCGKKRSCMIIGRENIITRLLVLVLIGRQTGCLYTKKKKIILLYWLTRKKTLHLTSSLCKVFYMLTPKYWKLSNMWVRLLNGNDRSYTAKVTRHMIKTLVWEVLSHPLYFSDIGPLDNYLFFVIINHFQE